MFSITNLMLAKHMINKPKRNDVVISSYGRYPLSRIEKNIVYMRCNIEGLPNEIPDFICNCVFEDKVTRKFDYKL